MVHKALFRLMVMAVACSGGLCLGGVDVARHAG